MREMFDETKLEIINNLRRNLYDATNAEYISSTDVKNACVELKKYLPDDFRANFFEIAVSHNERKLTQAIRKIDVAAHYEDIENIVKFLIKSLQPDFLLELNNLIERAYKSTDLKAYEKYATEISVQAEKVQLGVYETKLPREVFVAYSSKDMSYVSELVEVLEGQGLKCFVAARNLRHGKGSVENYDKALKEAIDHCKSFVFVSTTNSRSFSCDALEIEIPYVQKQDTENAPAEYRNNYAAIPHKYKKPRVEYRVESSKGFNAADEITKEFFDGYEWVLSPSEVAVRIMKQLVATPDSSESRGENTSGKKYCASCGTETDISRNVCPSCGRTEFVDDIGDFIKLKNKKDIEDRRRREQSAGIHMGAHKSKGVAILLAFFLGLFGVDQFYLGRTKRGVGRIIATCLSCGIVGCIWSLVDCVKMATGSLSLYPEEDKKKGKTGLVIIIIGVIVVIVIIIIAASAGESGSSTIDPEYNYGIQIGGTVSGYDGYYKFEDTTVYIKENGTYNSDVEGSWGDVSYKITTDGVITISGSGEIPSLNEMNNARPWDQVHYEVTTLVIEEGITSIGEGAFRECRNIRKVTLPASLTEISPYAFSNTGISSLSAPGVKTVGAFAFEYCSNLINVELSSAQTIEMSAFANCNLLSSVTAPEVITIGLNAFCYCNSLSNVSFGDKLTTIEQTAFYETAIYNQVNEGEPLYMSNVLVRVPQNYSGTFQIKEGTVSIAVEAMRDCTSLKVLVIPTSVKIIDDYAIYDTYNLERIIYVGSEEEWKNISFGDDWNYNAGSYTKNSIPEYSYMNGEYDPSEDADLSSFIFYMTDGGSGYYIQQYTGTDTIVTLPTKYLSLPVTGVGNSAFSNTSVVEVTIPAGYKEIQDYAFQSATKLEKVTFEDGIALERIGDWAFNDCKKLKSITIPASVTEIGDNAFANCAALASISFEEGSAASLGNWVFENCTALKTIVLPETLTNIGSSIFSGCQITDATIPVQAISSLPTEYLKTLTVRGGEEITGSLGYNSKIETLVIGDSITTIGDNAFDGCQSLKTITFGANLTTIGSRAFADCDALESIVIPEGVTTMRSSCFASCSSLKSATLPTTLTDVGSDMFSGCNALETVTMPANAISGVISTSYYGESNTSIVTVNITSGTRIPNRAFSGCTKLRNVNLCEGIMIIGDYAFENCLSLLSIELPSTVNGITSSAFSSAPSLVEIINHSTDIGKADFDPEYDSNNPEKEGRYVIHEGESIVKYVGDYAFITKNSENYLISYLGSSSEITLPEAYNGETYAIRARAFEGRTDLTKVNIVGAHTIGDYAFRNSTVKEVTVGDTVTNIGIYAFEYCNSLTTITFGTGLKEIGLYAFNSCSALEMITIPANVDVIGRGAFSSCDNLLSVVFSGLGTFNIYDVYEVEPTTPYATYSAVGNSTTNAGYLRNTYCDYKWVRQTAS